MITQIASSPDTERTQLINLQELENALYSIDANSDRDTWVRALMGFKAGGGSVDAARDWSSGGASFNPSAFRATWNSIKSGGGITESSLFSMAHDAGWRRDKPVERPVPVKIDRPDTGRTEARATRAVELSTPAPDNHPYLVKKGIQPHGIGVLGELYDHLPTPVRNKGNVLVIPMQNVHAKILSCQFIAEDGSKAYMAGSKRKGGFYFIGGNERLWVCEGFATGASIAQDAGDSVAVAFDANGLMSVTDALTALYPKRDIKIMADDDWQTDGNPGLTKARQVADVCGVQVVLPDFTGFNRGSKDTDYNDVARLRHG